MTSDERKAAHAAYMREWRQRNHESCKEKAREYRRANPERVRKWRETYIKRKAAALIAAEGMTKA